MNLERVRHAIVWALSRQFVRWYVWPRFRLVLDPESDPIPSPPFILVSNHGTFFDPWLVGGWSKYPLSIMMNDDGYRSGFVARHYLRWVGTFGKKKGASDYRAMKTTLKRLSTGSPVLIFPEGQTTWDGETQPIYAGVEKIVKRARCPMVMCRLTGNFLCKPWWAENQRSGHVRLLRETVYEEQLAKISDEEVLRKITTFIHNNDVKDPGNLAASFTGGGLAEGLERFVWMCPSCRSEDRLATESDTVRCASCGAAWIMDGHCRFEPLADSIAEIGDLHDWAAWHKRQVKEKLASARPDEILTTSSFAVLQRENEQGVFVDRVSGSLSLTREMLTFTAQTGTETLQLAVAGIDDYVFERKDVFECRHDGTLYRFRFQGHSPMKWVYYFRYLNGYQVYEEQRFIK